MLRKFKGSANVKLIAIGHQEKKRKDLEVLADGSTPSRTGNPDDTYITINTWSAGAVHTTIEPIFSYFRS